MLLLADASPLLEAVLLAPLPERLLPPPRPEEDLEAVFFDAAFLEAPALEELLEAVAEERLRADLEAPLEDRDALFEDPDFFDADFPPFLLGTFSPASLASDKPMAMACLREVTFFPLRPLFN